MKYCSAIPLLYFNAVFVSLNVLTLVTLVTLENIIVTRCITEDIPDRKENGISCDITSVKISRIFPAISRKWDYSTISTHGIFPRYSSVIITRIFVGYRGGGTDPCLSLTASVRFSRLQLERRRHISDTGHFRHPTMCLTGNSFSRKVRPARTHQIT